MNDVDAYIRRFPEEVQEILEKIRSIIKEIEPNVVEKYAYGLAAYHLHKRPLIYFGAFKSHVGVFALPSGHQAFREELKGYKQGKGSVQFPLDQPIPYDLIARMVSYRVAENDLLSKVPEEREDPKSKTGTKDH